MLCIYFKPNADIWSFKFEKFRAYTRTQKTQTQLCTFFLSEQIKILNLKSEV